MEEHRADVIVVFSADRLVRSTTHLLQLVERIESMGAHVASMQDGSDLDTTSEMGELLVFMRGWLARMELKLIRRRIMAGLDRARANHTKLGRKPEVVDVAAVRRLRDAGKPWSEIAAELKCTATTARRRYEATTNKTKTRTFGVAPGVAKMMPSLDDLMNVAERTEKNERRRTARKTTKTRRAR